MKSRLEELAQRENGYRDPQFNIPNLRSLPQFHNGTWEPFRKFGEKLPLPKISYEILEQLEREGIFID